MAKKPKSKASGNGTPRASHPAIQYLDWRRIGVSRLQGRPPELLTYKMHLDELLKHKGKYVVIKGDQIVGVYDDREQALDQAYERFGDQGAFVKEIGARDDPLVGRRDVLMLATAAGARQFSAPFTGLPAQRY